MSDVWLINVVTDFAKEENVEGDNPPIGIVMSHYKDELMVEYATYGMDSNLFVSKYELFLPNKEELRKLVMNILKWKESVDRSEFATRPNPAIVLEGIPG